MLAAIRNNRGLTLVEIMVVMIILAIGIIPLTLVQTRSQRDVHHSNQRTEALFIAQMQMERARNLGFTNAVSDSGAVRVYQWRTDVQPVSLGLNQIEVTVQWNEKGTMRTVTLDNLVSFR